jgi:ubiquinone/menaquinone biosynthesis C-methylase UbiE
MERIKDLYWIRFSDKDRIIKNKLWKVLCKHFLQKYINKEDSVLDLGAGYCEFINNVNCRHKYGIDINEDTKNFANKDVTVFIANSKDMKEVKSNSIDIVFASEFFEHLKNTEELFQTLIEIQRILKKGGKLLIICPNIRYLADKYWDFIDHRLPLSHESMNEGLLLYGFKILKIFPKFVPYTTKSVLPKRPFLLALYLKLPFLWQIFGKQMFVIAQK